MPKLLKEATIAVEDKDFYKHGGIDPIGGIVRALKEIVIHRKLQGGSTITQQLIKSALLTNERTIQRKIREILLAFWAERLYSKDQILEMYLNQVPYGGTAWGIQTASQTYFGKNVSDLTLAESALLAGLPAAPTYYSPFGAHPEEAEIRKNQVLDEMVKNGKITQEDATNAKEEKITFAAQTTPIKAPHFVMYVKELLEQKYGLKKVERGGLRIITSLDLELEQKIEDILTKQLDELKSLSVGNGAVVVTNPKTGEILSMIGSKNYFDDKNSGNFNVTTSLRQPGSSIKAVTYTAALENGFTAASIIEDTPVSYPLPNQLPYTPVNYDGRFHGRVSLRKAFANSYNIPAVKVLNKIGLDKMISYGRSMGIQSWNDTSRFGLSLTLGAGEVTMLDMARVYGTLANYGKTHPLIPILSISSYEGQVLEETKNVTGTQVVKPETAYIVSNILSDNETRSDAFGRNSKLEIPGKTVAVKTGTSNDKRDNWTIGYTPSYVVTVWVGNNDNSPMNPVLTSGITGATPIWNEVINELLAGKNDEPFATPSGIISLPCYGRKEYFITGTQPQGGCPTIPPETPTPTP
ncbi:MAG: PBP1A family penicillin-binding protein [Actinobacteria bacterium]|nr:PBP1A family penicillin-binding protein [Actinomycetota bacterium]